MGEQGTQPPVFLCDAMLGGLARWLRAAGYDARFDYGIDDRALIERARQSGGVILSSDGPMFERNVIKSGQVRALYVPQQLSRLEQLRFVVDRLRLPRLETRCMACGGRLAQVPKHRVMGEAPPLAFRNCERFWRCGRCGKLFWQGTHWQRIDRLLGELRPREEQSTDPPSEASATEGSTDYTD
ncbi:MAG TPA: Mut7-C RNAse domain-containing protein [Phycisphaerae bacterium]|nr:Mut7-C RNAse domain-containing protein [Phycisphaerae bacterium]